MSLLLEGCKYFHAVVDIALVQFPTFFFNLSFNVLCSRQYVLLTDWELLLACALVARTAR